MKLISLNVEGGRQGKNFFDYIKQHSSDTDIFCLQEVLNYQGTEKTISNYHHSLYQELQSILPEYKCFFAPEGDYFAVRGKLPAGTMLGNSIFIKNDLVVRKTGSVAIFGNEPVDTEGHNEPKNAQYAVIEINGKEVMVINIQGGWYPGSKLDTPERLEQSRKIKELLASFNGPKILTGDFNLMPDTESIKTLEQEMVNLIKEFKITNTRNEISWNKPGNTMQHFADYTLVSPGIKVKSFEVPYNLVSDHLPMILDFELKN